MRRFLTLAVALATLLGTQASLATELPQSKRTELGLYLTAEETQAFLTATPEAVMIDVRTPEEIDAVGIAAGTDALIPLAIRDPKHGQVYNPDFFAGFAKFIQDRNLGPDHPIVIICRSGNRSAVAANALSQYGFTQLYTVTDGFEGDRARSGPTAGQRTVNGWKNAGLPWEHKDPNSCAPANLGGTC